MTKDAALRQLVMAVDDPHAGNPIRTPNQQRALLWLLLNLHGLAFVNQAGSFELTASAERLLADHHEEVILDA